MARCGTARVGAVILTLLATCVDVSLAHSQRDSPTLSSAPSLTSAAATAASSSSPPTATSSPPSSSSSDIATSISSSISSSSTTTSTPSSSSTSPTTTLITSMTTSDLSAYTPPPAPNTDGGNFISEHPEHAAMTSAQSEIVGLAVGLTIALILLLGLAGLYFRRTRRTRSSHLLPQDDYLGESTAATAVAITLQHPVRPAPVTVTTSSSRRPSQTRRPSESRRQSQNRRQSQTRRLSQRRPAHQRAPDSTYLVQLPDDADVNSPLEDENDYYYDDEDYYAYKETTDPTQPYPYGHSHPSDKEVVPPLPLPPPLSNHPALAEGENPEDMISPLTPLAEAHSSWLPSELEAREVRRSYRSGKATPELSKRSDAVATRSPT